jgi:hypothetical protein
LVLWFFLIWVLGGIVAATEKIGARFNRFVRISSLEAPLAKTRKQWNTNLSGRIQSSQLFSAKIWGSKCYYWLVVAQRMWLLLEHNLILSLKGLSPGPKMPKKLVYEVL